MFTFEQAKASARNVFHMYIDSFYMKNRTKFLWIDPNLFFHTGRYGLRGRREEKCNFGLGIGIGRQSWDTENTEEAQRYAEDNGKTGRYQSDSCSDFSIPYSLSFWLTRYRKGNPNDAHLS